jgi:hypothetical protein
MPFQATGCNMGRTCVRFKVRQPSCPIERLRFVRVKAICSYPLIPEACNDSAMLNRAPLHAFEIIFYSTASVLAAVGLTWYFLH